MEMMEEEGKEKIGEERRKIKDFCASEIIQEVKRYTCLLRDYVEIAVNERVYYVRKSKTVIYF
mgnify:CR=1 FL=1